MYKYREEYPSLPRGEIINHSWLCYYKVINYTGENASGTRIYPRSERKEIVAALFTSPSIATADNVAPPKVNAVIERMLANERSWSRLVVVDATRPRYRRNLPANKSTAPLVNSRPPSCIAPWISKTDNSIEARCSSWKWGMIACDRS